MAQTAPIAKDYGLFLGDTVATGEPVLKLVVCATSVGLSRTNNITKTETKCGVIKAPGAHDYSLTLSGVTMINPDAGNISEYDLHRIFKSDKLQAFKIASFADNPAAGNVIYEGEGYVSTLNSTWPTTDNATFELTIDVFGEVEEQLEVDEPAAVL